MKWNDDATTANDGQAQLADTSFYKWLDSYGWKMESWNNYGGYGQPTWTHGGNNYNIRFQPFYLVLSGAYIQNTGQDRGGYMFYYWSSTPAPNILEGWAGYLGYNGSRVGPARHDANCHNAFSLRCLTQ